MLDQIWSELSADWQGLPHFIVVGIRLVLATLVAAVPGLEREQSGNPAGLRTHILVALGSAVFMMIATGEGASVDANTRVMQGIATGIGFVGAGAILKSARRREVHGLTTAASIWLTAALGTAVGAGQVSLPILGCLLSLLVLYTLRRIEPHPGDGKVR